MYYISCKKRIVPCRGCVGAENRKFLRRLKKEKIQKEYEKNLSGFWGGIYGEGQNTREFKIKIARTQGRGPTKGGRGSRGEVLVPKTKNSQGKHFAPRLMVLTPRVDIWTCSLS